MFSTFRVSLFFLLTNLTLASDLQISNPESVNLSSERLDRVAQHLRAQVNEGQIVGAVAMVARKGV